MPDVKAENILVSRSFEDPTEMVCAVGDLDCAKRVVAGEKAKTCVGSPIYMAPEVLSSQNVNPYSETADGMFSSSQKYIRLGETHTAERTNALLQCTLLGFYCLSF